MKLNWNAIIVIILYTARTMVVMADGDDDGSDDYGMFAKNSFQNEC